ncbi:hypothetical protein UlMin_032597 [Ulmus minor]
MAMSYLRLRRTLNTFSTARRSLAAIPATHSSFSPLLHTPTSIAEAPSSPKQLRALLLQSRPFRSSSLSLLSARSTYGSNNQNDEIGPDTILFEGCDYNHWLIVMDFPKDPKPSPEDMVRTYEETCSKGLNISLEEAKQKIYACSTTTYTGFQCLMSEEESEKFNGLPGVIFVLPDSYIDPVNKEYGGDKYINGTIIPRPPPVQFGRQQGRYRDHGRNDQPRYDRPGQMPNQQRNPSQQNYGSSQQNFGPQNYPSQQNYGPPGQGERRDHQMPMNAPGGRNQYQPQGDASSYQGNYNQGGRGNFYPPEQRTYPQGDQRNYAPPTQQGYGGQPGYRQGVNGYQGQGAPEANWQGTNPGSPGQGTNPGSAGQGTAPPGYGQNYPGHNQGQSFSQREERNVQGQQGNYADQGRFTSNETWRR